MNLAEAIQAELKRARELLVAYKGIPTGAWGAMAIERAIEATEKAMLESDTVALLQCYEELKGLK